METEETKGRRRRKTVADKKSVDVEKGRAD
jgi:hypothetical protein